MAKRVVVPLRPGSDGDPMHRPVGQSYTEVDPPTLYLEKIATAWMKARGEAQPGVSYILEGLPAGYALFQKPRANQPSFVDKWLYGHPRGRPFDSPNRFFPHFEYIMDNNGNSIGCPCSVCVKGGVLPASHSRRHSRGTSTASRSTKSSSPKPRPVPLPPKAAPSVPSASASAHVSLVQPVVSQYKGRPKKILTGMDTSRIDEEGTPDVYRNLIDKLRRYGSLDEAIIEPMSLDWRSEQATLSDLLEKLGKQQQWIPRVGDIVLYIRKIPEGLELLQNEDTGEHAFYDPNSESFRGTPIWEAGLVGQVPGEPVDLNDAICEGNKEYNVSLSGVRVEPLPNPNDKNKSLSKRYRYIPVNHTRPFFLWEHYLEHTEEDDWHPTIRNVLTAMSSLALMGRYRFRGEWPEAQIYNHGIYIGSEFITVGDTVRLLPKPDEEQCTAILVIKSIRLLFKNLDKASNNDYDEGRPYNSHVWIHGSGYTMEASRSSKDWVTPQNVHTPRSADKYAKWYPSHPANKELAVPFHRVLGRLYEHDAMHLWLPRTKSSLDAGREGVMEARAYARENDNRIIDSLESAWFWGDSRAEALDLQTVNGLETSKFDAERDPREWRRKIKLMEGVAGQKAPNTPAPAAKGIKSLRSFMAPATSLPVHNHGGLEQSGRGSGSSAIRALDSSNKRGQTIDLSEDDDEEENIRRSMKIVEEDGMTSSSQRRKKAKVVVCIE